MATTLVQSAHRRHGQSPTCGQESNLWISVRTPTAVLRLIARIDLLDVRGSVVHVRDPFRDAMRLMRARYAGDREDGFHTLLPHAAEYIDRLIDEFQRETEDHGLRCWLLELIGEARSEMALPVLVEQLYGDDESLRWWAIHGLRKLNTKRAREELWKARCNGIPGLGSAVDSV